VDFEEYDTKAKKKVTKKKFTSNYEKRTDFIKKMGEEAFEKVSSVDKKWKKLRDIPIPDGYAWIWNVFLQIWMMCERDFNGNIIFTPRTILDYEQCFGVNLSILDRHLLVKMKDWASEIVYELKNPDK
jgi:hypothetical protein